MKDHGIAAAVVERQRRDVAFAELPIETFGLRQLAARDTEHFGAAVDARRLVGARAEQFDHAAGAGADIDQPSELAVERGVDRAFDLAFGDMKRAQAIPMLGVGGEIAFGGGSAIGAHRDQPRRVGDGPMVIRLAPLIDRLEDRLDDLGRAGFEEDPAAFLAAARDPGFAKNADVTRNARLALPEHLREFADRQLHPPQQRDDPQSRRIGKRTKDGERAFHLRPSYKEFFICRQRAIDDARHLPQLRIPIAAGDLKR